MKRLPTDVARCKGVQHEGEWRVGCEHCLRRTSSPNPLRQVYIEPPAIIACECEYLIEEE
jgi:hypothetical protein